MISEEVEIAARPVAHLMEIERPVLDGVENTEGDRREHRVDATRPATIDHLDVVPVGHEPANDDTRLGGCVDHLDVGRTDAVSALEQCTHCVAERSQLRDVVVAETARVGETGRTRRLPQPLDGPGRALQHVQSSRRSDIQSVRELRQQRFAEDRQIRNSIAQRSPLRYGNNDFYRNRDETT